MRSTPFNTVIPWGNSLADFHPLSLAKINIKKKSAPDVLQAYITQSQNPGQYFPVVFCLASRGPVYILKRWFVNTLHDSASFRELSSLIELKYLYLLSNLVINNSKIFALIARILSGIRLWNTRSCLQNVYRSNPKQYTHIEKEPFQIEIQGV